MIRIAVEHPFTDIRRSLENKGYQADMIEQKTDAVSYDVVVVRDHEDFADFRMSGSLVEARGRTVNEVVEEVEERLARAGKIEEAPPKKPSGSAFAAGLATGAAAGAAAALLLTPKSGKEMQSIVKEKMPSSSDSSGQGQSSGGTMDKVKEKANQLKEKMPSSGGGSEQGQSSGGTMDKVKEKVSGVTEKAKDMKGKVSDKAAQAKEKKDMMQAQKEVTQEVKAEQQARKEHEKAEKQAEKEMQKSEKEQQKGQGGGVKVFELEDAEVQHDDNEVVVRQAEVDVKKKK